MPIHRTGKTRSRNSTQTVPRAMYWRMNAAAIVTPATKPPPGRSCPRSSRKTATAPITGKSIDIMSAGIAIARLIVSPLRRSGSASSSLSCALLFFENRDAFGRRSESPQQRIDSDRDDAEHRDLAERVERAEVDQDDVHDVGAATPRIGVFDKEASDALRRRTRHDYVGERGQSGSCRDG